MCGQAHVCDCAHVQWPFYKYLDLRDCTYGWTCICACMPIHNEPSVFVQSMFWMNLSSKLFILKHYLYMHIPPLCGYEIIKILSNKKEFLTCQQKKIKNHAEVYFNIQHIILLRQPDSKLSVGCLYFHEQKMQECDIKSGSLFMVKWTTTISSRILSFNYSVSAMASQLRCLV